MQNERTIEAAVAPWRSIAMICSKCSRKLRGGFGKKGRCDLADVLKRELKDSGRRREVLVIEVGCLGLCPKHAVSVVSSAVPGQVLSVAGGAEPALVLGRLSAPATSTP